MKLSIALAALAAQSATADWFGKAVYNKWHETELERWLDDHNIPHPKASDRKDLEDLVKKNWDAAIGKPYSSWDVNQLSNYLKSQGKEVKKGTEKNKDALAQQVQAVWHETADQASEAYSSVQNWIFDSWTESQLKSFLDYHQIPNPSPRNRDSLLSTARSNYAKVAEKAGEVAAYPGNWLWQGWSDSDLKAWLDERGIPAPQPSTRDKLVAQVRRNSKIASDRASEQYASLSASASGAAQSLSDQLIDSWSETDLKAWFDKNGIKVPQGSKKNELVALARKHAAKLSGDNVASKASASFGAATSSAGNYYPQATNEVYAQIRPYYDWVLNQIGFASAEARSSLSSASVQASSSLSSASVRASSSVSSAASQASIDASKLSVAASKSAASASKEAVKSGKDGIAAASSAASEASKSASASASSASKEASKSASASASSASKQASKSAASASAKASAKAEL